ncbi:holo-[acyl-carrier-protein] synthase [Cryptococcus depauperatus]|nr:holo-[acyl-carrier-protein] synthase [Cryptococcus depauperatus CBS 7855]
MISGIGVDILSLSRFHSFVARRGAEKVARRICSPKEFERFRRIASTRQGDVLDQQVQFLSSRWCIKEAAYKSLFGLLPSSPTFKTFQLVHASTGQPRLDIVPQEIAANYALMPTLSHDAGVVVGVVVSLDKTFKQVTQFNQGLEA